MVTREDVLTLAVRAEREGRRDLAGLLFAVGGMMGGDPTLDVFDWTDERTLEMDGINLHDLLTNKRDAGVALANKLLVAGSYIL